MKLNGKVIGFVLCLMALVIFAIGLNGGTASPLHSQDNGRFHPLKKNKQQDEEEQWEQQTQDDEDHEGEQDREGDEEGEEDDEDEEGEQDDLWHHLEEERAHVEANIGRLEMISRLTDMAGNDNKLAGYAIMHIGEFLEPEEAMAMLREVESDQSVSKTIRNLARMKLAEVYAEEDRIDEVKRILKTMIHSK